MKISINDTIKGFTLIELLVVIAIIAVLATVVFVALDPAQRFLDSRNSRRWNDVNNYLTAIHECIVDQAGIQANCLGSLTNGDVYEMVDVGTSANCDAVCAATSPTHCAALSSTLAPYLASLPLDPGGVASGHTEYSVSVDANGIVTVASCSAEDSETIQVSR